MSTSQTRRSLTTRPRRPAPRSTWTLGPARLWATIWFCNDAEALADLRGCDEQPDVREVPSLGWRDPML